MKKNLLYIIFFLPFFLNAQFHGENQSNIELSTGYNHYDNFKTYTLSYSYFNNYNSFYRGSLNYEEYINGYTRLTSYRLSANINYCPVSKNKFSINTGFGFYTGFENLLPTIQEIRINESGLSYGALAIIEFERQIYDRIGLFLNYNQYFTIKSLLGNNLFHYEINGGLKIRINK